MRENLLTVSFIGNTSTNKEVGFVVIAILKFNKKTIELKGGVKRIFWD